MKKYAFFAILVLISFTAQTQANSSSKPNEVECWTDKAEFERRPDNPNGGLYRIHYTAKDYYTWHLYYSGDINVEYNDISDDENFIELQDPTETSFIFFSAAPVATYDIKNKVLNDRRHGSDHTYSFCRESSVLRTKKENIPFEGWM